MAPSARALRFASSLASLALASCVALERQPGVMIASEPPGARVSVNGKESGFVTPCNLGLPRSRQRIDLALDGYRPASVLLDGRTGFYLIHWREAFLSEETWRFPLWLNYKDGLFPVKVVRGYSPARIHVPLVLAAEE